MLETVAKSLIVKLFRMHGRTCRWIAYFYSRCPRCMLETVARSPLVLYGGHDACQKLSLDRLQLFTVDTMHVRNCRQIAFSYLRWPRCMLETVARSPFVNLVGHDICQNLSLDCLSLVTLSTMYVRTFRQFAICQSVCQRSMLETVVRSPLVNYGGQDICQNLLLDDLNLSRTPRCMVEPVVISPLVSHVGHNACHTLSLYRLQLITVSTLHVRICRQIAFIQSRQPRCLLKTVARLPLVSYAVHDAWQKLSVDCHLLGRLYTMHVRNFARSPLVNYGGHDICQNLSLDPLQLFTLSMMHGRICRWIAFSQSF